MTSLSKVILSLAALTFTLVGVQAMAESKEIDALGMVTSSHGFKDYKGTKITPNVCEVKTMSDDYNLTYYVFLKDGDAFATFPDGFHLFAKDFKGLPAQNPTEALHKEFDEGQTTLDYNANGLTLQTKKTTKSWDTGVNVTIVPGWLGGTLNMGLLVDTTIVNIKGTAVTIDVYRTLSIATFTKGKRIASAECTLADKLYRPLGQGTSVMH